MSTPFPAFPKGAALPVDQAAMLQETYNRLKADYELRPYADAHPIKAAISGFLSGGLPSALGAGAYSRAYRKQAQEKDITGFTDAYKQALANQKDLDAINILGNDSQDTQALINEGQRLGIVSPSIPSISGQSLPGMNVEPGTTTRRVHSKEFLDSFRNGAFGGSDLNYYQDSSRQNALNFRDIGQNLTPSTTSNVDANGIKTGINKLNDTTNNVQAPFFVSNPTNIMQNLQQIQSAGLAQGTEKYKFDQEAPKRNAEIIKALSEGRSADALAILRKAQTDTERQMPAKVRAETFATTERGKLERRTDPNSTSGSASDPLLSLGRMQEALQRQKQAVLSQMQQNGFIDKTTGMIAPPDPKDAWSGVLGMGAHGSNANQVKQFNILRDQLNSIDNQLTGGSVPQQIYPPKPGNSSGKTRHNTSAGPVEY